MTDREHIEQQIRDVLATETRAVPLSNKLFQQEGGLFGQLASTEEERWAVTRSPLFKEAQKRLTELREREMEAFSRVVDQVRATMPEGDYLFKLEERKRA